jgi:hypothetical protein
VRRAAFVACDLKLRPVKEKAAANALAALLDAVEVAEVVPEVPLEVVAEGEVREGCRLWTDIWRLFARAFSCWRINCAKDCSGQRMVSQSFPTKSARAHSVVAGLSH